MRTKYSLMAIAAGLMALGAARPAAAQDSGVVPVRVKVGVFLPQGDAKTFAGSTQFNAEVDVALPSLMSGRTFLSAGYYHGNDHGNSLSMVPITLGRVFSPPNPAKSLTGNVYYGLGAGAYFIRARSAGVSKSGTRPGGYAMLGYQFPNPYFVEAKYQIAGSVGGVSPHGLALMVGRHF